MATRKALSLAIAAAIAASLATTVSNIHAAKSEKCYGIAKAGKNDCATPHHACAGQAKTSGDKKEWIMMPKGLCDKIVAGQSKSS
ncbi:BufA1 family periplasmic bufferin-type metallophore [Piscirickettsia salmonis]|nr:DUF2282 domain-containing protein [Piscirickettsia salmonis]ALT18168.1 hypothetical protein PSLF89_04305 [Piscirickettsia salmonis LF-89 = ATCC VR-1361]ALY02000.1 hypothetical protein AWE47_03210 [Piscirickettsia salmonis]AMA41510.1 hypothetical protein AWJ11_03200 [Piscirickettsia salmonis]AOS33996.1 hypothetical protein AVM72_00445 [Piscirickettsia salmonis]APS61398.1 hypothetical protein AVI53_13140 [Piscirickettsia salmonis]